MTSSERSDSSTKSPCCEEILNIRVHLNTGFHGRKPVKVVTAMRTNLFFTSPLFLKAATHTKTLYIVSSTLQKSLTKVRHWFKCGRFTGIWTLRICSQQPCSKIMMSLGHLEFWKASNNLVYGKQRTQQRPITEATEQGNSTMLYKQPNTTHFTSITKNEPKIGPAQAIIIVTAYELSSLRQYNVNRLNST